MKPSDTSKKHRTLRVWTAVLGTAASLVMASGLGGCIIVDGDDRYDDHHGHWDTDPPPELPDPLLVDIETDQTVDAVPGEGVGLFVEYSAGGKWLLWTTCDTNYSNVACKFDVFASVDTSSVIESIEGLDLEGYDSADVLKSGEAQFHAETASDIDAIAIDTTPGAILRVEVSLDGVLEDRFVYWVSNGILHEGAPSNPVDFQPSTP